MLGTAIPMNKWELLVDYTTTEDVNNVNFTQGDNGQVLNNYDALFILQLYMGSSESVKMIKMSISNSDASAWNGKYNIFGAGGVVTVDANPCFYALLLQKTVMGILPMAIFEQANKGSVAALFGIAAAGSFADCETALSTSMTASILDNKIAQDSFDRVALGCYMGTPISAGSRFQIFGAKL